MNKEKNILDHLKPQKPDIPDRSYFEALVKKTVEATKPNIVPIYRRRIFWMGSAAAVVLCAFLVRNFGQPVEDSQLLSFNDISTDYIEAYIEEHIETFDDAMIFETLSPESIAQFQAEINPEQAEEPERFHEEISVALDVINNDDIYEYFEEQGININDFDDEDFM